MTIDDEIKHCEEVAENQEWMAENYDDDSMGTKLCKECAEKHRQVAEWLRELKKYRAIFEKIGRILRDNGYTMDDLDTIFGKANDEEVNTDE